MKEQSKIPTHILRRLRLSDLSDDMKENSLRLIELGEPLDTTISKGANYTADDIIPWHDQEGNDYDENDLKEWVEIFKKYLIDNYGTQTKEYISKTIQNKDFNNDGNKYVFWKHSEINGGNGFSESHETWGELILGRGWWFPLDWREIKSELDKMDEGKKLILRPGDKHNTMGYYFSIIKVNTNMRESIKRVLKEQYDNIVVYHGTPKKHSFNTEGYMFNGTFFSVSENEAKSYGKYVYKVTLKPNLNFIDTNKFEDCELIIDEFETLIDTYYNEDEPEYYITEPEQIYYNSDSWSIIESNDDVIEWLMGNYDGIWIYEGGVRNLLLFKPIDEKIKSIKRILKEHSF
jgi:hypothetical protein